MESSSQFQIQSYAVYLRISGILLLVGKGISEIPFISIIGWVSPVFLLASVILLFLFLEKMNYMSITNSRTIRISQISMTVWGCLLSAGIYVSFFVGSSIIQIIIVVLIAIFQLGCFFFLDRIFNDLILIDLPIVKIKSIFLLSFSFYGFIELLPPILSVTLGLSPISFPLFFVINIIGIILSIAVAIILIILPTFVGITEQVQVQYEPAVDTTQKPIKQFCSNCGARIESSKTFCENCGLSLK